MKRIFSVFAVVAIALSLAVVSTASAQTASCTFTRSLTLGSTGADVVALQTYLETKGYLVIPTGVSKGYFGPLTQSALAKYQAAMGIAPAAGYFGPITTAKVMMDCSGATPTTPGSSNSDDLSGGEASLESFDLSSGDDSDIEEDSTGDIAEIEFDVEDADVLLNRVDLAFVADSTSTDLWDVFEEVELVLDGDVIGSADLSDEDEYLDEDEGTVRISGINTKLEEGDSVTIIVRVTTQNNVDSDDLGDFTVNVEDDGIRATDAEGIEQYIGDEDEEVEFTVEEAGSDEELNVSSSSNDPDATNLKVEDDAKSDAHTIFVFDLEAEDNDIELDTVDVSISTGGTSTVSGVISDLTLEIDGEEFTDWEYTTGTSASSTRTVQFDIDGDFTIDADDEVEVVLWAEFKAANGSNYTAGATVSAEIANDGDIQGEGADDVSSEGTTSGEDHTLSVEGIVVPASGVETSTRTQGDNDTVGIFTIEFEVTAFEEDFYITDNVSTDATSGVGGVEYTSLGSGTTTATLTSTADENSGVFTVEEGQTETFTLTVTFDPAAAGQYRLTLDEIWASTNTNGITGGVVKLLEETDFRTAYENINI